MAGKISYLGPLYVSGTVLALYPHALNSRRGLVT